MDEGVSLRPFPPPLGCRQHNRINLAPQLLLRRGQQFVHAIRRELIVARDHQDINVAAFMLLAAGKRTENKRGGDLVGDGLQCAQNLIAQPNGADDDLLERLENR